jgi:protein-S-isoprenylcysteine O-methyltransferase Ste14
MVTIIIQLTGWFIFIMAVTILGKWLRKNPSKKVAERTSLILHFLFWVGVAPPIGLGFFYPGLDHFDEVLRLDPFLKNSAVQLTGIGLSLIGSILLLASNIALWTLGGGTNAFLLTKRLVAGGIYQWTRNPMSLGIYLIAIGIGLLVGSTYLTIGALLLFIPAHIFYLKYFEEYELELRLGQSFNAYKQSVPFLLPRFKLPGKNEEKI